MGSPAQEGKLTQGSRDRVLRMLVRLLDPDTPEVFATGLVSYKNQ